VIHISTDYVFPGDVARPLTEEDSPSPLSAYGTSKRNGETAMLTCSTGIIIRTSWLYSTYGNNFVKSMIRLMKERDELRIVYDQVGTPTYGADLAGAILKIIDAGAGAFSPGIFHYSNEGIASWYDFAFEIRELTQSDCRIIPITTAEYPLPARRPAFAVLSKEKIRQQYMLQIPHWKSGLQRCIKKMKGKTTEL
jgi:dTDP-4-dehydrorhamnose reductase